MSQVEGWDLTRNIKTFREAATAFRNARDWAQEHRDTFITAANERARSSNPERTRTEGMTDPSWLATRGGASEPPASHRDSGCSPPSSTAYEGAGHAYTAPPTLALSEFNGPVGESESSAGAEYVSTESSTFDSSTNNGPSNTDPESSAGAEYFHAESSTFDSSTYNGPSEMYPVQESETSADELALDSYATPATPRKRRHRGSGKTVSKAPRHSHGHCHGKSGQSRHSKR